MKTSGAILISIVTVVVITVFLFSLNYENILNSNISTATAGSNIRSLESAKVIKVIDGDTVKVETNSGIERIRFLHINTAEKGERCYEEAKQRVKELIGNKTIWLERDMKDEDQYKRKLRYIFLYDNINQNNYDSFVNLMLIKEGLASFLIMEPNLKYNEIFEQEAEKVAKSKEGGCLFEKSPYFGCFSIEKFHYNARGSDCDNPNDEYVIIKDNCSSYDSINLNNWIIKDSLRHKYLFKNFTMKPNSTFILHSGLGIDNKTDNNSDLFWNQKSKCPIVWNNDHDSLFMRDSYERLVLYSAY